MACGFWKIEDGVAYCDLGFFECLGPVRECPGIIREARRQQRHLRLCRDAYRDGFYLRCRADGLECWFEPGAGSCRGRRLRRLQADDSGVARMGVDSGNAGGVGVGGGGGDKHRDAERIGG